MHDVLAYHVIITTYGFWLPNDPRGSGSKTVRADNLKPFGEATIVESRHSVAAKPHDYAIRRRAKEALKYEAVMFSARQIELVAEGFSERIRKSGYTVWAFAPMDTHCHYVVKRHTYPIEQVDRATKQSATMKLLKAAQHPFAAARSAKGFLPSVWAQDFWKVYLYSESDIRRAIEYVENNPVKAGLPKQKWDFVEEFKGWK